MTTGKGDGCVVDIGHKTTRVGLWKDYKRVGGVATVPIGGYHVTERLQKLLNESGYCFTTTSEREILDDVKQKHGCFP
jgi:actin-related protein